MLAEVAAQIIIARIAAFNLGERRLSLVREFDPGAYESHHAERCQLRHDRGLNRFGAVDADRVGCALEKSNNPCRRNKGKLAVNAKFGSRQLIRIYRRASSIRVSSLPNSDVRPIAEYMLRSSSRMCSGPE